MITDNQTRRLLRCAALSAAMLLMAGPAALADPPANRFQDFGQNTAAAVSAPVPSQQRNAVNRENGSLSSATISGIWPSIGDGPFAAPSATDTGRSWAETAGPLTARLSPSQAR
jgi:hypothetical protein